MTGVQTCALPICYSSSTTGNFIGYNPYYFKKNKVKCTELKFIRIGECISGDDNKEDNYIVNFPGNKKSIYWINWQQSDKQNMIQLLEFDSISFKELSRTIYLEKK